MGAPNHCGGRQTSQQCHKYFLQFSTFASERPQVRTWGHQTCFLPRAPSNLVTSLTIRTMEIATILTKLMVNSDILSTECVHRWGIKNPQKANVNLLTCQKTRIKSSIELSYSQIGSENFCCRAIFFMWICERDHWVVLQLSKILVWDAIKEQHLWMNISL